MNIIITNGFEPNFTVGFVRGLVSNSIEVLVVSCDETAHQFTAEGIRNVNLRGSTSNKRSVLDRFINMMRYYICLIALLVRHAGATVHFSGIFRNEFILWEGLFVHSLMRVVSRHYIYTVHNVLPHSRGNSRFFRAMYRWVYKLPGTLLVHTDLAARQLVEEFGVDPARIRKTSIGLNEEMPETSLSPGEARKWLGIEPDARVVLFFGKIDDYKGLDILLEAFDGLAVQRLRLVVAGEFRNEEYRTRIHAQIERLSRRQDVRLHERFIPNAEAAVFFKAADVLCLPYRNIYQSGLVFLGPRFGVPMVVSDVGSMREFVDGRFGIVSRSNDAVGIREALKTFFELSHRLSRTEILEHARLLGWSSVCADLSELYSREPNVGGTSSPRAVVQERHSVPRNLGPIERP